MSAAINPIVRIAPPAMESQHYQKMLGDLLAEYMAAADLVGRLHVMQDVKRRTGREVKMSPLIPARFQTFDESVLDFESVPFEGAIRRIANLTSFTKVAFDALKQRYQEQAFTVAGLNDVGLIDKIQQALVNILGQGGTQRDFNSAVQKLTSDAGVEDMNAFHLETVFQTNIQRAYQNGKFEQMRDPAVTVALPYWQYTTAGDDRVRPAHAALDGFTARYDDAVWRRLYPPCGFNCRCTVIALGPDDVPDDADQPGEGRIPFAASSVPDPGFGGGDF